MARSGQVVIDFATGEVTLPDGTVEHMAGSLDGVRRHWCRSAVLSTDQDVDVRFDRESGGGIRVEADDVLVLSQLHFRVLYITVTTETVISVVASTSTLGVSFGLKKNLTKLLGLGDNLVQTWYPTGTGVTVTGAAGANTYGDWAEVVAADTVGDPCYIRGITGEWDAADTYTVQIGSGEAGSETVIAEFRFEAQSADTTVSLSCDPYKVTGSPRIAARCKSVGGASDTITELSVKVREAA